MASVFSKIVKGEIPCYKVAEAVDYLAFLDVNPIAKGHTLIIPKIETDYIFNIDDDQFAGLHLFSKKVALAIEQVVPCKRIGIAVLGLEVPHAHIHLIPINGPNDINFNLPKLKFTHTEMQQLAMEINNVFNAI